MSKELIFMNFKEEYIKLCNSIILKYLDGKHYTQNEAKGWTNLINEEITKSLYQGKDGFKYVCNTIIFQKGKESLHFVSTCLWNNFGDGSVIVKFENDTIHCFVCLLGIAPY